MKGREKHVITTLRRVRQQLKEQMMNHHQTAYSKKKTYTQTHKTILERYFYSKWMDQ